MQICCLRCSNMYVVAPPKRAWPVANLPKQSGKYSIYSFLRFFAMQLAAVLSVCAICISSPYVKSLSVTKLHNTHFMFLRKTLQLGSFKTLTISFISLDYPPVCWSISHSALPCCREAWAPRPLERTRGSQSATPGDEDEKDQKEKANFAWGWGEAGQGRRRTLNPTLLKEEEH